MDTISVEMVAEQSMQDIPSIDAQGYQPLENALCKYDQS